MRKIVVTLALLCAAVMAVAQGPVVLRSRVQPFKGSPEWQAVSLERPFQFQQTALVLCDMWDHHWCKGAESRVGILAAKMTPVIDQLRANGVIIIHAPLETMEF